MMYFAKYSAGRFVLLKKGYSGRTFRATDQGGKAIVASLQNDYPWDIHDSKWEILAVLPEELVQ